MFALLRKAKSLISLVKNVRVAIPTDSKEILIWDKNMLHIFTVLFESRYLFLPIRGEVIYLDILLRALLDFERKSSPLFVRYSLAAIEKVKPKLVITGTDNNPYFYTLKPLCRYPNVKFASVQNARRVRRRDLFGFEPLPRMAVDKVFAFSHPVAGLYRALLGKDTQIEVFGSLKASFFLNFKDSLAQKMPKLPDKPYICFVSEYHPPPPLSAEIVEQDLLGRDLRFDEYFLAERLMLPALAKFARQNKMPIVVALRRTMKSEADYFQELLTDADLTLVCRDDWSSYFAIAKAEVVVSVDSTLGYEAFALGAKCYMTSFRVQDSASPEKRFAWPAEVSLSGPVWQNFWDEQLFLKKMGELLGMTTEEYLRVSLEPSSLVIHPGRYLADFTSALEQLIT